MKVNTGKGTIPLMTLIAIWSISLTVNLPGLAISPMLGNLDKIFPGTSELEIQLLTVLPNLCIIPFVLLSGRLSLSKSKIGIVVTGLAIYLASGILYLFARNMVDLIVLSCLLGIGCGLLIPLAAGLIADTFTGKYRMTQLGIKSGISNMALVAATYAVGWLGHGYWRMPFIVYLIPAIPLVLSVFLRGIPREDLYPSATVARSDIDPTARTAAKAAAAGAPASAVHATRPAPQPGLTRVRDGFIMPRVWSLVAVYFFVCYATVIVSYYTPFLMQSEGMNASQVGTVTAIFFLAVFLPGFILPYVLKVFRQSTLIVCTVVMGGGVLLMAMGHSFLTMCTSAVLIGFGYGVFQPLIYDKATQIVTEPAKATLALAIVLAANYISISATPFIVDGFRDIFDPHHQLNTFPFILNSVLLGIFTVIVFVFRKSFVFQITRSYY